MVSSRRRRWGGKPPELLLSAHRRSMILPQIWQLPSVVRLVSPWVAYRGNAWARRYFPASGFCISGINHTRAVLSHPPDTAQRPSGENATLVAGATCPS